MTCLMMVRLGVYALGAADAGERQLVEDHLPGCAECRAELARLMPLPGLLAQVPGGMLPGHRARCALGRPGHGGPRSRPRWRPRRLESRAECGSRPAVPGHPRRP